MKLIMSCISIFKQTHHLNIIQIAFNIFKSLHFYVMSYCLNLLCVCPQSEVFQGVKNHFKQFSINQLFLLFMRSADERRESFKTCCVLSFQCLLVLFEVRQEERSKCFYLTCRTGNMCTVYEGWEVTNSKTSVCPSAGLSVCLSIQFLLKFTPCFAGSREMLQLVYNLAIHAPSSSPPPLSLFFLPDHPTHTHSAGLSVHSFHLCTLAATRQWNS